MDPALSEGAGSFLGGGATPPSRRLWHAEEEFEAFTSGPPPKHALSLIPRRSGERTLRSHGSLAFCHAVGAGWRGVRS